jgi:HTH-type transcriptional regulator/antitoxin HigA
MGITLDPVVYGKVAYGKLLAAELPKPIENDKEFDRAVERLEELDFPSHELTPEETALREVLAALIDRYGERFDLPEQPPREMVRYLMEQRGLKQADLVPVLGTRAQVSDVVTGRRGISEAQAKKLAEFFRVRVDLFL